MLGVFGDAGRQQQLNIILAGAAVGVQVAAAANIGIDRYLNRLAGSTLPADKVDYGPAALLPDALGGFGG